MMARALAAGLIAGALSLAWAQQAKRPAAAAPGAVAKKSPASAPAATPAGAKRRPAVSASDAAVAAASGPNLGLTLPPHAVMPAPPAQTFQLPNGLRVLLIEDRELPLVTAVVAVRGGWAQDPAGKAGLADLTLRAMRRGGSAKLEPAAVEEKLSELRVGLEAAAFEGYSQVGLRTSTASRDEALTLFRDLVVTPQLDPDVLETLLGAMREEVSRRNDSIPAALQREFRKGLWGEASRRGQRVEYDSIENLAHEDVVAFHRRYFTPANMVLALEGDLSLDDAKALAGRLFGGWQQQQAGAGNAPEPATAASGNQPKAPRILYAERPDSRNTAFIVGAEGGKVGDADYAAMLVLMEGLAGAHGGRLAARSDARGGWRANWTAAWDAGYSLPGTFQIRAALVGAFTTDALKLVSEELASVRNTGLTEAEFETAKTRALHNWVSRFPTNRELAAFAAMAHLYGLPPSHPADVHKAMAALTRAEVARAAAARIKPETIAVVAGAEALFDKPLSSLGTPVETIDLTIAPPKPVQAKKDPASEAEGKRWLERMQQALGGAAKLAAITDLSVRSQGTTIWASAPADIKLWDRWVAGGTFRQEQEIRSGTQILFYNGKIAWVHNAAGLSTMPPSIVEQIRGEMFRYPFSLALSAGNPKRTVSHLGANLVLIGEGDKHQVRLYLDPETALPQRLIYRLPLANGGTMTVEEAYSDWKKFDGIGWPGRIVVKRNGRKMDDVRVSEARFNSGVTAAQLEKRP